MNIDEFAKELKDYCLKEECHGIINEINKLVEKYKASNDNRIKQLEEYNKMQSKKIERLEASNDSHGSDYLKSESSDIEGLETSNETRLGGTLLAVPSDTKGIVDNLNNERVATLKVSDKKVNCHYCGEVNSLYSGDCKGFDNADIRAFEEYIEENCQIIKQSNNYETLPNLTGLLKEDDNEYNLPIFTTNNDEIL